MIFRPRSLSGRGPSSLWPSHLGHCHTGPPATILPLRNGHTAEKTPVLGTPEGPIPTQSPRIVPRPRSLSGRGLSSPWPSPVPWNIAPFQIPLTSTIPPDSTTGAPSSPNRRGDRPAAVFPGSPEEPFGARPYDRELFQPKGSSGQPGNTAAGLSPLRFGELGVPRRSNRPGASAPTLQRSNSGVVSYDSAPIHSRNCTSRERRTIHTISVTEPLIENFCAVRIENLEELLQLSAGHSDVSAAPEAAVFADSGNTAGVGEGDNGRLGLKTLRNL